MIRILRSRVWRYRLRLGRPIQTSFGIMEAREGLLLECESEDGAVGWGEASPLPGFSAASLLDAESDLRQVARKLTGMSIESIAEAGALAVLPSPRFAAELAIWRLLDGADRPPIPVNALLAGDTPESVETAKGLAASGVSCVKLKVGRLPAEEDIARIRKVSAALGERVVLRLDANRAWSLEQAIQVAEGIRGVAIEYVEEPLAKVSELSRWYEATGLPLALDETLTSGGGQILREIDGVSAAVVKPTVIGGIEATLRIAAVAKELGMACVISSSFESGVALRGLAALAHDINPLTPAGLDTSFVFDTRLTDPPFELQGGMTPPAAPWRVNRQHLLRIAS